MFSRLVMFAVLFGGAILAPTSGNLLPKVAIAPKYPPLAALASVSGSVIIQVTVDEAGNVMGAEVVSGHPLLRKAATEAARKWKFENAPVQRRMSKLEFRFVLLPERNDSDLQTTFYLPDTIEVQYTPAKPPVNYGQGKPGP